MSETAQIVIVASLAVVAAGVVLVRTIGRLGIGRPGGKPDCGCGTCAKKRGERAK